MILPHLRGETLLSHCMSWISCVLAWHMRLCGMAVRVQVTREVVPREPVPHHFTGPLLHDVLTDAGPVFDAARRKDRLRFLIAVRGTDGHRALLPWAEIDPDFGRVPVLLAVALDDTLLDRAGPQLVLPQDRCGARYISGIDTIRVDGGYTAWT